MNVKLKNSTYHTINATIKIISPCALSMMYFTVSAVSFQMSFLKGRNTWLRSSKNTAKSLHDNAWTNVKVGKKSL